MVPGRNERNRAHEASDGLKMVTAAGACLLRVKVATDAFGQVLSPCWEATEAHGLVCGTSKPFLNCYCSEQVFLIV